MLMANIGLCKIVFFVLLAVSQSTKIKYIPSDYLTHMQVTSPLWPSNTLTISPDKMFQLIMLWSAEPVYKKRFFLSVARHVTPDLCPEYVSMEQPVLTDQQRALESVEDVSNKSSSPRTSEAVNRIMSVTLSLCPLNNLSCSPVLKFQQRAVQSSDAEKMATSPTLSNFLMGER